MSDKLAKPVQVPEFTSQDAQKLIHAAQMAPLQNMQAAAQLSQLLERFEAFTVQAFKALAAQKGPPE